MQVEARVSIQPKPFNLQYVDWTIPRPIIPQPPFQWPEDGTYPVAKEKVSWFKPHPLVLVDKIQTPYGINDHLVDPIQQYTARLYNNLSTEYAANGCPTMYFREGERIKGENPNAVDDTLDLYNYSSGAVTPREAGKNLVVVNPVYLGELDADAMKAISNPDLDFEKYKQTLRDKLPENSRTLYALTVGGKLELDPPAHPHFTNLIFIKDQDGAIEKLPHDRMLVFMRLSLQYQ